MIYIPSFIQVVNAKGQNLFSCQTFCAYHSSFSGGNYTSNLTLLGITLPPGVGEIAYAVFPDLRIGKCPTQCGSNASQGCDGLTKVITSHELAEACTDPEGGQGKLGWLQLVTPSEIGDLCVGQAATLVTSQASLAVQYIWSQQDGACIISKDFKLTTNISTITIPWNNYNATASFSVIQLGNSTQKVNLTETVTPPLQGVTFTVILSQNPINQGNVQLAISYSGHISKSQTVTLTITGTGTIYSRSVVYTVLLQKGGS